MAEETFPQPMPPENPEPREGWDDGLESKTDSLTVLSWCLVAIGIVTILTAVILRFTSHILFVTHILYPQLLAGGVSFYVMGRVIVYYRRFRKKRSPR